MPRNKEDKKNRKISKLLSYILRHNPKEFDAELDSSGWTDVKLLISSINSKKNMNLTLADIEEVVLSNDKKRFVLESGNIRASQGHSVKGVIAFSKDNKEPPQYLFHGTTTENYYTSIESEGLRPMQRHHVHLSSDVNTAEAVARRWRTSFVILRIKAKWMFDCGGHFYLSDNGVWLTDSVLPEYIEENT